MKMKNILSILLTSLVFPGCSGCSSSQLTFPPLPHQWLPPTSIAVIRMLICCATHGSRPQLLSCQTKHLHTCESNVRRWGLYLGFSRFLWCGVPVFYYWTLPLLTQISCFWIGETSCCLSVAPLGLKMLPIEFVTLLTNRQTGRQTDPRAYPRWRR